MHGVFLDTDTVDGGDLDLSAIETLDDIEWSFFGVTEAQDISRRISGCEVVICNKLVIDRPILDRADELKLIVVAATGTDNIDVAAAGERGIAVCNVRGYGAPSVVQHVYALILALTTRLPQYLDAVGNGVWQKHPHFCFFDFPIRELAGCVLGIVGCGNLGNSVAAAAPAFGMEVRVCQRPGAPAQPGRIPLHELLQQVDVLSLHCPLTEATRGLIGETQLSLMKDDAILINTARGGIVDEQALVRALCGGNLGGAGVDVLPQEPPSNGNILLNGDIPNLIVTPHIAWASKQSRQRVINIVADDIRAFFRGAPQNTV